jgi:hypothetical protein
MKKTFCVFSTLDETDGNASCCINVLWHVDPLLGNDREIIN